MSSLDLQPVMVRVNIKIKEGDGKKWGVEREGGRKRRRRDKRDGG